MAPSLSIPTTLPTYRTSVPTAVLRSVGVFLQSVDLSRSATLTLPSGVGRTARCELTALHACKCSLLRLGPKPEAPGAKRFMNCGLRPPRWDWAQGGRGKARTYDATCFAYSEARMHRQALPCQYPRRIVENDNLGAILLVVRGELVGGGDARAVRVEVARHVVLLRLHVLAQVVEGRGRDDVALAVDLPGDRGVARAHVVVARGAGGGAGVHGDVLPVAVALDGAGDQVVLLVRLVVDDDEGLRLHADLRVGVERGDGDDAVLAEHAIVEGGLHRPRGAARAGGRVGPVDLVGLADLHVGAVLPVVRLRELRVGGVVVVALVAQADRGAGGELAVAGRVIRALAVLVELADRQVLGSQVPVHVDRAEAVVAVVAGDGHAVAGVELALVALGHVGARLLKGLDDVVLHAVDVGEVLVARARVLGLLALARVDVGVGDGLRRERAVG